MRTLSARILLGFTVLTIAFGVITATVVVNMREVENEAKLIGNGYMRLTLNGKDLFNRQEQLVAYLDAIGQARDEAAARKTLRTIHDNREKELRAMLPILDSLDSLSGVDPRGFAFIRPKIEALETAAGANDALYKKVLETPPVGITDLDPSLDARHQAAYDALKQWKPAEIRVKNQAQALAIDLDQLTRSRVSNLQDNEHIVRTRTIYLGIVAVVLGLLVTSWVVITLRPLRRLRDGARRVAAGDYGSRIPQHGPTDVAELAREFNAMGAAVQERERELVRQERLAAIGMMTAKVAHEVRNPLSSIGLNTELLLEDHVDTPEARELCRAITKEVDRLAAFTEECLAFATLPSRRSSPNRSTRWSAHSLRLCARIWQPTRSSSNSSCRAKTRSRWSMPRSSGSVC
jgi:two-component system NtrC family sensor kinase